jgi:flagellar protein FliO/FliZ
MSLDTYFRFVLALVLVVALILILAWIARRSGFGPAVVKPLGRRRRLAIVETLTLDPKRRLVIVRRDGTEHLLLLGGTHETVIEHGIAAPEPFALPDTQQVPA